MSTETLYTFYITRNCRFGSKQILINDINYTIHPHIIKESCGSMYTEIMHSGELKFIGIDGVTPTSRSVIDLIIRILYFDVVSFDDIADEIIKDATYICRQFIVDAKNTTDKLYKRFREIIDRIIDNRLSSYLGRIVTYINSITIDNKSIIDGNRIIYKYESAGRDYYVIVPIGIIINARQVNREDILTSTFRTCIIVADVIIVSELFLRHRDNDDVIKSILRSSSRIRSKLINSKSDFPRNITLTEYRNIIGLYNDNDGDDSNSKNIIAELIDFDDIDSTVVDDKYIIALKYRYMSCCE